MMILSQKTDELIFRDEVCHSGTVALDDGEEVNTILWQVVPLLADGFDRRSWYVSVDVTRNQKIMRYSVTDKRVIVAWPS